MCCQSLEDPVWHLSHQVGLGPLVGALDGGIGVFSMHSTFSEVGCIIDQLSCLLAPIHDCGLPFSGPTVYVTRLVNEFVILSTLLFNVLALLM